MMLSFGLTGGTSRGTCTYALTDVIEVASGCWPFAPLRKTRERSICIEFVEHARGCTSC